MNVKRSSFSVSQLVDILSLDKVDDNLFKAKSPSVGWQRIYGGQVLGQAIAAANMVVEDKILHSMHCYFILAGKRELPIYYKVNILRSGRSFKNLEVIGIQEDRDIFKMLCSFHKKEEGLSHQFDMPKMEAPENLPSEKELIDRIKDKLDEPILAYFESERPIEWRSVDGSDFFNRKNDPHQRAVWIRLKEKIPNNPKLNQAILAYASDLTLLDTTLIPHDSWVFDSKIMTASLDHTMWFHSYFSFDDWILFVMDTPFTGSARGLARGLLYDRQGKLISSVVQEGLIRLRSG